MRFARWWILSAFAATPVLAGPAVVEPPGGDAGGDPNSAQAAGGTGPLGSIGGSLGGTTMGRSAGASSSEDYEDMFKFRICNAELFSARTLAEFDTQLWLFDGNGLGILANDDASMTDHQARIFPPANDGTSQEIPGPGVYYLAISGAGNSPRSGGGAIFSLASATERSGPDGPGSAIAITEWTGGGETGDYLILLQGAALLEDDCHDDYVTNPLVPALSDWGLVSLALVVLSAGTIVVGRTSGA